MTTQSENQPYVCSTRYTFEVQGVALELYANEGNGCIVVKEAYPSGGPDTEQYEELYYNDGVWTLEYDDVFKYSPFVTYSSREFLEAILEYVNKHGVPQEVLEAIGQV